MTKRKPRVRKPRYLKVNAFSATVFTDVWPSPITIGEPWRENDLSLENAKRLHKWLGQAISYIEQEEKKR